MLRPTPQCHHVPTKPIGKPSANLPFLVTTLLCKIFIDSFLSLFITFENPHAQFLYCYFCLEHNIWGYYSWIGYKALIFRYYWSNLYYHSCYYCSVIDYILFFLRRAAIYQECSYAKCIEQGEGHPFQHEVLSHTSRARTQPQDCFQSMEGLPSKVYD